jgi:crotonobetainyl-CoA:carnitine CoA-transferase CaiB-like acyl-CoA transferase
VVEVTTDAQWQTLCAIIGRKDLAADARLRTLAGRKAHEDMIDRAVEGWTIARDRWQVMQTLQRAGISASVVETLRDQLGYDPRMRREHFQRVAHPSGYEFMVQRLPIRVGGEPPPASPHPSMGADNDYVFGEILGLKQTVIDELIAGGVLT